jgi:hydrogenase maturation protein HypF
LEACARRCPHPAHHWEKIEPRLLSPSDHSDRSDLSALIETLITGYEAGADSACLAAGFHRGFAALIATALLEEAARSHPAAIGLSGGVAQNQLFTAQLRQLINAAGYELLEHRVVPANDGGLSLGMALAGYLTLTKETA